MVPNCPLYITVPNCPWCQIVLVPNCPRTLYMYNVHHSTLCTLMKVYHAHSETGFDWQQCNSRWGPCISICWARWNLRQKYVYWKLGKLWKSVRIEIVSIKVCFTAAKLWTLETEVSGLFMILRTDWIELAMKINVESIVVLKYGLFYFKPFR